MGPRVRRQAEACRGHVPPDDDALAEEFFRASCVRAAQTHDRAANLNALVGIYDSISYTRGFR